MGGGARTLADPEYAGVAHDICSAVHPLALASPFLAEFDCRPRRDAEGAGGRLRQSRCPAGPPPSAITTRSHLRRVGRRRVVASATGTACRTRRRRAQVAARRQTLDSHRSDCRRPDGTATGRTGHAGVARATGSDARALFTGVAAHTISQMPSMVSVRRGADAGHAGAHRRLADTRRRQPSHPRRAHGGPQGTRWHTGVRRGSYRSALGCRAFRHRTDCAARDLPRPNTGPLC